MKNKILIAIAIISTLSAIHFANRKQEVIVHFSKPVQPVGNSSQPISNNIWDYK